MASVASAAALRAAWSQRPPGAGAGIGAGFEVGVGVAFGVGVAGAPHAVSHTATARPTPGRERCMGHGPSGQERASTGDAARLVGAAAAIDGSRRRANYWHSPRNLR